MSLVYLSLGSNLGDRGANLQKALVELEKWGVKIVRISSLYESEPVGLREQPWFLNMAVRAETTLGPEDFLNTIHFIEKVLGRERTVPNGPRTIDIDILFFVEQRNEKGGGFIQSDGGIILDVPGLQIPHPRLHERKFVLVPMAEIAPEVIHPKFGKNTTQLLKGCEDMSVVREYGKD